MNVRDVREKIKEAHEKDRKGYIEHVKRASPAAKLIVKYWLLRSRFLRLIRSQISWLIRQNLETECLYCKTEYGL